MDGAAAQAAEAEQPPHFQAEQQEEEEDEDNSDPDPDEGLENYDEIFNKLRSDWLMIELNHRVSKTATELFWKTALKYFPKMKSAVGNRRTAQFKTIRKKLYDGSTIPEVKMEIGYRNKRTGELELVNCSVTPVKNYSPANYEKIFEIASVKVSQYVSRPTFL